MAVFDLFSSRRQFSEAAEKAEVFVYDKAPSKLKIQLQQIFSEAVGRYYKYSGTEYDSVAENNESWDFIAKTLRKERGVHQLYQGAPDLRQEVLLFLGTTLELDGFLDTLELILKVIEFHLGNLSDYKRNEKGITQSSSDAIAEVNIRMKRAAFGYQYESGEIIRVDSTFIHSEIVKPALTLLSGNGYEGPQSEFLTAHRHYREGNYKDAVTWANKSFESAMKAICVKKGWKFDNGARASDLLKVIKREHLLPEYLDASFDQLAATLKSGLPQIRNEAGAHGDGPIPLSTPSYIAAYALHLAAAKIVLIVEAADRTHP